MFLPPYHRPFFGRSSSNSATTRLTFYYNSRFFFGRFHLLLLILAYFNVKHLTTFSEELNNLQQALELNKRANNDYIQTTTESTSNNVSSIHMQILALFSGTSQDLGIDHRLGRQILRLATNKAKLLYPELKDIELIVQSDDTPCTSLNLIPSKVVEYIYINSGNSAGSGLEEEQCSYVNESGFSNISKGAVEKECREDAAYSQASGLDLDLDKQLNLTFTKNKVRRLITSAENNLWIKRVDAIIGPSCDFLVDLIARMAAYWRTPIYSVASISASFSRKDIYSTLTRLSPSVDHLGLFILKIMERFKWRHLAIIVDKSQVENVILSDNLDRSILKMQHLIPIEREVFQFNSLKESQVQVSMKKNEILSQQQQQQAVSSSLCTEQARETLLGARKVARVFLFLLNDQQVVRKLLLCAYELNMNNGEFTFLAVNLNLKSATMQQEVEVGFNNETSSYNGSSDFGDSAQTDTKSRSTSGRVAQTFDWYSNDDETNNVLAREMFESLLLFSIELPIGDEYNYFVEETLDMVHREYPQARFERSSVGSIAVALHDSLLIAVEAHLRSLKTKSNNSSSPIINKIPQKSINDDNTDEQQTLDDAEREFELYKGSAALLWNEHYSNGLIKAMHINSNGDQEMDYVLSDLEPETGVMRPVVGYSKELRQLEFLPNSYIHWPRRKTSGLLEKTEILDSDKPPPDEPECGFNDDAERCIDRQNLYAASLILAVLLILIVISTSISIFKYRHIKYQMQLDDYWWKINWDDLKFIQGTDSLASNAQSIARAFKAGDGASSILSFENDAASSIVSVARPKSNTEKLLEIKRQKSPIASSVTKTNSDNLSDGAKKDGEQKQRKIRERRSAVPLIVTSEIGHLKSVADTSSKVGSATQAASLIAGSCLIRSDYSSIVRASNLAMYKNELIIVKQLNTDTLDVSRELLVELKSIRELISDNLAKFVGLCLDPGRLSILYEYCSRGSLKDLLLNTSVSMDWTLKYSIIGDIVNGLNFIHTTLLDYHGRLKSTNIVLDSRFTVKITDFGLQSMYSQLEPTAHQAEDESEFSGNAEDDLKSVAPPIKKLQKDQSFDALSIAASQSAYNMDSVSVRGQRLSSNKTGVGQEKRVFLKNRGAARYFWTAPEHLREKNIHNSGSKKGDVYSFAVILFEIFTRKEPYWYGTSGKPHWASIRQDRFKYLKQSQELQKFDTTGSAVSDAKRRTSRAQASSEVLMTNSSSVVGSITRQAKRAQGKLKRINAAVNPLLEQLEGDEASTETGSAVSVSNLSLKSLAEVATPGNAPSANHMKQQPLRPSVAAIDEEGEVGEEGKSLEVFQSRRSAESNIDAEQVLDQIRMGIKPEPIRPYIPNYVIQEVDPKLIELMRTCWSEEPTMRPNLVQIRNSLRRITRGIASKNYLDNLLERLQNYAENLERIVDSKSADIVQEKVRTEELLYQLVPKFVAERLKLNEPIIPQVFDGVTIFFSDIVGFEKYASVMSPVELVDLLNNIYSSFDSIISSFDVTKIETIIDQFLVASGISWQQEESFALSQYSEQQQQQPLGNLIKKQASLDQDKGLSIEEGKTMEDSDVAIGKRLTRKKTFSKVKKFGLLKGLRRSQASIDSNATNSLGDSKRLTKNASVDFTRIDSLESQGSGKNFESVVEEGAMIGAKTDSDHNKQSSAEQIARMALCIRDLVKSFHFRQNLSRINNNNKETSGEQNSEQSTGGKVGNIVATSFNIRIGMHSGKVCAGIVGLKRPKFCLIGDTVNVASRMHTNSKANKIQISADTKNLLEQVPGFNIEARGRIEVKGKGMMETFWLESSY